MKRKKVEAQFDLEPIQDWEHADKVLQEMSVLTNRLNERISKYNQKEQVMRLKELTQPNQADQDRLFVLERSIEAFSLENRNDFGKMKSKELNHGIVSFRTGTPKVVTRAKYTLEVVVNLIKKSMFKHDLLRTKIELDKEAVLSMYKNPKSGLNDEVLNDLGLKINQDETFGYELKDVAEGVQ